MSFYFKAISFKKWCLNPYYNGKYSMSKHSIGICYIGGLVLILIIMENTL